ncbi:hypothetical protein Tco_0785724 [Tanacetum coccineum]
MTVCKGMRKYGVTTSSQAYSPKTSGGQVGCIKCGLNKILKGPIGENRLPLVRQTDDALWAFPYSLQNTHWVYSLQACVWKVQLNELNELRDHAYENSLIYKAKTKRLHDSKIKNRVFNIGDRVLLFNSRLKIFSGKLKSRWNGPFTITRVFPYGTVELSQANGPNFKDCPDCEDSQFCHSSRVSHPQLQLGIRYPNLID